MRTPTKLDSTRWTPGQEALLKHYIAQKLTHREISCLLNCKIDRIKAKIKRDEHIRVHGAPRYQQLTVRNTMGRDRNIKCSDIYMAEKMMVETLYEVSFEDLPEELTCKPAFQPKERHTTAYGF